MADTEGAQPAPIDEGFFADVGGAPQWITLRGADRAGPPLLMLFGPGAGFTRMAPFFAPWERDFTLVQWDQPGGGATFAKNGEMALSLDRLAADAAAVASGTATLAATLATAGATTITATYVGDTNYTGSGPSTAVTVNVTAGTTGRARSQPARCSPNRLEIA